MIQIYEQSKNKTKEKEEMSKPYCEPCIHYSKDKCKAGMAHYENQPEGIDCWKKEEQVDPLPGAILYKKGPFPGVNLANLDERGSHYRKHPSGVECKDIIGHMPYNVGAAMKYLWRCDHKHESPLEDLKKAIDHINFEIERLSK